MKRMVVVACLLALVATLSGQSKPEGQVKREECVKVLSTFAKDPNTVAQPEIPGDLEGVTLEYFASGCFGRCPAFTLKISKDRAEFNGHAFVKAKGKRRSRITAQQFAVFVRAWLDGKLYAMRDDYCRAACPDGTVTIITDVQETSVTLKTPTFTKTVYECFTTTDGKPDNPRPPEQYFQLSRQLLEFVRANNWL